MFESPTRGDDAGTASSAGEAGAAAAGTLETRLRPLVLGGGRGRVSRLIEASPAAARQVLEAARMEAGLSKAELARRAGVSKSNVTVVITRPSARLPLVTATRWLSVCGYDVVAVRR